MKKLFFILVLFSGVILYGARFTGMTENVPAGSLKIFQIDIPDNIGDIYIITAPDGTVTLVDTGVVQGRETVLINALDKYHIRRIDKLIISHFHSDHAGGAITLLADPEIEIGRIICSYPPENEMNRGEVTSMKFHHIIRMMAQRKNIPFLQVNAGDILNFGSGTTGVVISGATGKKYGIKSYNSQSLVFKLIHKNFTMLFTGDCGFEQENIIFASGADLKCDVLKMAHHGGAGSNSERFIDAAAPTIALAPQPRWLAVDQRGIRVENLLKKRKIPYFRSWEYGDIVLFTDGESFGISRL